MLCSHFSAANVERLVWDESDRDVRFRRRALVHQECESFQPGAV